MKHTNIDVKFAVLGGGSWGTALVKMLSENQSKVWWYMRSLIAIDHIKTHHHNPNYLSAVSFDPEQLILSDNINKVVAEADVIIMAIPSAFLQEELEKITVSLENKTVFSAIKGIVPESKKIVGEHLHLTHNIPYQNIGVITGPCHAEEVALEKLSYLTIACADSSKATLVAKNLQSEYLFTKVSDDIIGTEYAAMLKNIYAIAVGIAHGLGYGDNFQSVLMSNAIREMKVFIKKVHKMKRDINNSAYLGDLLVTGYSVFSRNRLFGNMIGKGYTVKSAMMEMTMVAEGYYATKSAYLIGAQNKAKTPIIKGIYDILYEGKSPKKVMKKLSQKMN